MHSTGIHKGNVKDNKNACVLMDTSKTLLSI